jgi:hypothetical protein
MNNLPLCSICNTRLDLKDGNQFVLNGFIDMDTKEIVHLSCKPGHYERKRQTPFTGLYSETPITILDLDNATKK